MSDLARVATGEVLAPMAQARPASGLRRVVADARALAAQPAVQKSLPMIVAAAVIALGLMLWSFAREPDRTPLFSGLGDADKAAVVEALTAANFDVAVGAGGGVEIPQADYHKAKMLLASQGLPKAVPSGYDLIGDMPMGASRAVEAARLKQGQESELANSVTAIDGVESARIHLALPEQSVFVRERTTPTASVFVKLAPGRALGQAQVRSIVHLVASSVPGLAADGVSVVDQNGTLLTQDAGEGALGESSRQMSYQAKLEQSYRERIATLLTPLVGMGNFTAEVSLDLDFTQNEQTRETYDRENVALRSEQSSNSSANAATAARGIPGALSNQVPPPATVVPANGPGASPVTTAPPVPPSPTAAPGGPSAESFTRNYEVGRSVMVTKAPVGQVRRMSVAVVVRDPVAGGNGTKPRSAAEMKMLEKLVGGAIGLDAKRGDNLAITSRPFAEEPAIEGAAWYQEPWVADQGRNLVALLVFVVLIFGVVRPLLTRAKAAPGAVQPQLPASNDPAMLGHAQAPALNYDDKVAALRGVVTGDRARARGVMKQLMRDGAGA